MRVLLISHTAMSRVEGQPKAAELALLPGVELCVLVPNRWRHYGTWRVADPPLSDRFRYHAAKVRWPWLGPAQWYLHWYPQLRRIIADFRPDVIDLWEEAWGLVSVHACRVADRLLPGVKIISETEQNISKKLPAPFEAFRRRVLRRADFVVARNAEAIEVVRGKGYTGPAEVVPNAVDTSLFQPLDRAACRAEIGAKGFVIGYAGRLVEEKGLADLMAAMTACPPEVNLLLIGSGPMEPELRRRAGASSLAGRVQFLGERPMPQLPRLFNALDVLVLPSRTTPRWKEQFGRVLIEAAACGVPVIGSNSGAIPQVVGENGVVFPEGDTAALASAIRQLAADPSMARNLGDLGRKRALAEFTWGQVAVRMHNIYHRVLNSGPITLQTDPAKSDYHKA